MLKVAWFYWKFIQNQKEVNKTYENGEITQHMWCALRRWIEWVAPIEVNLLTTKTRQFKAKANIHWFFIRNKTKKKHPLKAFRLIHLWFRVWISNYLFPIYFVYVGFWLPFAIFIYLTNTFYFPPFSSFLSFGFV